MYCKNQLYWQ